MKTVRCYRKYGELKKEISSGHYDISMDSVGQLINYPLGYSTDITIRDYDGTMCIDYDVYKNDEHGKVLEYLDGGKVCDVSQMPFTDKGFWRLIKRNIKDHLKLHRILFQSVMLFPPFNVLHYKRSPAHDKSMNHFLLKVRPYRNTVSSFHKYFQSQKN